MVVYDREFEKDIKSLYERSQNEYTHLHNESNSDKKKLHSLKLVCLESSTSSNMAVQDNTKNTQTGQEHLPNITHLDKIIEKRVLSPKCASIIKSVSKSIHFGDNLFYIYTSGTTGLPKPAIIKHSKFILASIMCRHIMGLREDDVLYTAGLPLYHTLGQSRLSTRIKCFFGDHYFFIIHSKSPNKFSFLFSSAGMVALSGSICNVGYQFVIRKKFSASNFWKDCDSSGATVSLYIGEVYTNQTYL